MLKEDVLKLVSERPRLKAPEVAASLRQKGLRASNSDVNSVLYAMQSEGKVQKDSDHRWRVRGASVGGSEPTGAKQSEGIRSRSENQRIELTPQQKRLVSVAPTGHVLIRGEAGSGKTTVLSHRAKEFSSKASSGSLLMLTYNGALAAYTRRLLHELDSEDDAVITTLHGWASDAYEKMTGERFKWVDNQQLTKMTDQALSDEKAARGRHRLLELNRSFWEEEISWIYGQGIGRQDAYARATRSGRGTAIQVRGDDREVVWSVFQRVHSSLKAEDCVHMDYAVGPLMKAIKDKGGKIMEGLQVDHVFVDEVQDFHPAWLYILSRIAKSSMTLAGDLGQRIYRRSFTWKSVGIDVVGRSHSLHGSFRTTQQIMSVAIELLRDMELSKDPDWVSPSLPSRNGPRVKVIERPSEKELFHEAANRAAGILKSDPNSSIVVAHHFNRPLGEIVERVSERVPRTRKAKGNELSEMPPGVLVTTYFQLKGLEFDHVILIGLEDRLMPTWWVERRDETETEDEAEEYLRRLVYVAMTRARTSVHLMAKRQLSRFFKGVGEGQMDRE